MSNKHSRNEPCPCGSGKKYKKCCELKEQQQRRAQMQLFRQMPQFRTQDIGKALSDRVFTILPNIAQDIGKALTLLSAQQEESKKREEKPENLL